MTTSNCNIAGITLVLKLWHGWANQTNNAKMWTIYTWSFRTHQSCKHHILGHRASFQQKWRRERERERANAGCHVFENKIGAVGKAAGRFTHWLVGRREVGNAQYHLVCILGTSCCCWGLVCSALQKLYPGTL